MSRHGTSPLSYACCGSSGCDAQQNVEAKEGWELLPYNGRVGQHLPARLNFRQRGQITGDFFGIWIDYARNFESFKASDIIEAVTIFGLSEVEKAAYDAPFPARIAMGGPRSFPGLANTLVGVTDKAWLGLSTFEKPFLTIWGGNDPGNLGRPEVQHAMIAQVPGAEGWDHVRLPEASHFLQDDQGEEIARRINAFIKASPDAAPQ